MTRRAVLAALLAAAVRVCPAAAAEPKAIFVVRHAEKISEEDQRLTEAGRDRARRLAAMLKDSGISAVFATDTDRAKDTARPLADLLHLRVAIYDTGGAMSGAVDAKLFTELLGREHGGQIVLVVGHANTIPDLLRALGCAEKISLAPDEYDNLFVVVPEREGPARLLRLRY